MSDKSAPMFGFPRTLGIGSRKRIPLFEYLTTVIIASRESIRRFVSFWFNFLLDLRFIEWNGLGSTNLPIMLPI